jgi:hypothetical protein
VYDRTMETTDKQASKRHSTFIKKASKYAPIDFGYIARMGIAIGIAVAVAWGVGYISGTTNGWDMKTQCIAGTYDNPGLC